MRRFRRIQLRRLDCPVDFEFGSWRGSSNSHVAGSIDGYAVGIIGAYGKIMVRKRSNHTLGRTGIRSKKRDSRSITCRKIRVVRGIVRYLSCETGGSSGIYLKDRTRSVRSDSDFTAGIRDIPARSDPWASRGDEARHSILKVVHVVDHGVPSGGGEDAPGSHVRHRCVPCGHADGKDHERGDNARGEKHPVLKWRVAHVTVVMRMFVIILADNVKIKRESILFSESREFPL